MAELIAMSIVGGILILGAVLFAIEARAAAQLAAAYLERLDLVAHGHYDELAAVRAKASLVFGLVGLLVLWTVVERAL